MKKFQLTGEIVAENIAGAIDFLEANAEEETVTLYIDSPGGSVLDGLKLFRAMDNFKGRIVAECGVVVASMAAFIALACDEIHVTKDTFFLLHSAWCVAQGTAEELRSTADLLEKTSNRMGEIVTGKAKDKEAVASYMSKDTWFDASDMLASFDCIVLDEDNRFNKDLTASYALLQNLPAALLALDKEPEPEEEEEEEETPAEPEKEEEEPEKEEAKAAVDNGFALGILAKAEKYL